MTANKVCSQCKASGDKRNADLLVAGKMNSRPYRANLCMEHHDMLVLDGAEFSPVMVYDAAPSAAWALLAENRWAHYERAKRHFGTFHKMAERAHAAYISAANRARAAGLDY